MAESGVEAGARLAHLEQILSELPMVAVAFSGGTDSAFLLAVCLEVLGTERVVAMTADSPLLPREELTTARRVAQRLGARHQVLAFDELTRPEIVENSAQRCYYCKRARFQLLTELAQRAGDAVLLHGENADDRFDFRPGSRAAEELHVRAPLAEAGLTKAQIRQLSQAMGLETWDLPPAACLASRIPYGTPLTREALERVEQAELLCQRVCQTKQLRVRDHFPIARLEVPPGDIHGLIQEPTRLQLVQGLKALGYRYVTCDLEGYRMGSLNETIAADQRAPASG
jgi:uncharacterized protein